MRERIAIAVCLLVLTVVVALSYLFAVRHNPDAAEVVQLPVTSPTPPEGESAAPTPSPTVVPAREPDSTTVDKPPGRETPVPELERGQALFTRNGCATCHAIAGVGNPRYPLDGVGSRLDAEAMQDWILGAGAAIDRLPVTVRRRKELFKKLPAEDLKVLVAYLVSLKAGAGTGPEH